MKVALGSDHAGLSLKLDVVEHLQKAGHSVTDHGTETPSSCDYPDFAKAVAHAVRDGEADLGILVCGTGQGMAMAANRHSGVRAAVIADAFTAEMSRAHNDANIACFGERVIGIQGIEALLEVFLRTDFEGGRHERRVGKIETGVAER